jgi:hypothetical protein
MSRITIGNDFELAVTLTKNHKPFAIDFQMLITATVVSPDRRIRYFEEGIVSPATPGTDFSQSLIIVRFTKAQTALITKQGPAKLMITLTEDEGAGFKHPSWFVDVTGY